jgi:hypothetical protein
MVTLGPFGHLSAPWTTFQETLYTALSYLFPRTGPAPARRHPVMSDRYRTLFAKTALITTTAFLLSPLGVLAQATAAPTSSSQSTTSVSKDRWLHVRVISSDTKGETVRVNVPLELAERVLPAIHQDRIHDGKVKIDNGHVNDVDLRAIVDAIRTSKDGEFVTVQSNDCDVRVAKQSNHLIVHVLDRQNSKKSEVEVKVPMKVVDALFSAGKDELDLVAALHALSTQGDTELVSVKDHENTVRVWLDSKNVTD